MSHSTVVSFFSSNLSLHQPVPGEKKGALGMNEEREREREVHNLKREKWMEREIGSRTL